MFKKILCTILFIICLSGCTNQSTKENIELEFWTLQLNNFSPYINNIINEYETQNPNIKIKWVDVPFSEGEKRTLASIMSKKTPDLININPSFASTLAFKGALIDIKKHVNNETINKYIPETWKVLEIENSYYGIPWYTTSAVTFYNQAILTSANIKLPAKTYDELFNQAKNIKEKTTKYSFFPNLNEDGNILKILNKYDISFNNFNNAKTINIYTKLKYLYENDFIPRGSITQTHRDSLEKYLAGQTAYLFAGANFLKIIKENAPDIYKQTKIIEQIKGSNNKNNFSVMNLVIPVKSNHKKEAVNFALFLTNHQNQLEFCHLAPILPTTKETLKNKLFTNKNDNSPMQKARTISAKQLNNAINPIPTMKNKKILFEKINYTTQEILLDKISVKKGLEQIEVALKKSKFN